jgi:transcriptional regulator with XRE-family HTH domain
MGLALEASDVKVAEMADELGVGRNTVGNYLAGRTQPSRSTLRVWALRTGVPFEWLLTGTITDNGDPGQETRMARCIRGPWGIEPTAGVAEVAA